MRGVQRSANKMRTFLIEIIDTIRRFIFSLTNNYAVNNMFHDLMRESDVLGRRPKGKIIFEDL